MRERKRKKDAREEEKKVKRKVRECSKLLKSEFNEERLNKLKENAHLIK